MTRAKITILSTTLASAGIGEWGFAALVEVGDRRILFDTGKHTDTVLRNARSLDVDLSSVTEVVLSHHHDDHVGGLVELRQTLRAQRPDALATVHVAAGMFTPRRPRGQDRQINRMIGIRRALERIDTRFVIHAGPAQIAPGVWVTGPVPRVHDERNWGPGRQIPRGDGWGDDTLPESQALVLDTPQGLVMISGCGHAGIVNTAVYARRTVRDAPIHAAIGGFHLFEADEARLAWTADQLRALGLARLVGAHCTGLEAVYRLRALAGLARDAAVVGAVGATFTLDRGIAPGAIAR